MLSKKSIRNSFILQLVLASTVLIVIFSIILYNYIKISIYKDLTNSLKKEAALIAVSKSSDLGTIGTSLFNPGLSIQNLVVKTVVRVDANSKITFEHSTKRGQHYLTIYYPYNEAKALFISITKNINDTDKLLNEILKNILTINLMAIFLILFYALFLSRMLLLPVKSLAMKLANMNESFLQIIDIKTLPEEFMPLGKSINSLVKRIQIFVEYQKELFIGTSHELKTPLAVMKTKNEVTLLKPRDNEKYIETIKSNNATIDEMNKMISNILEIGRQESAHFEEPIKMDLIKFLKEKLNNFKILAHQVEKTLEADISPQNYVIKTQPTLIIHILQNFVQNAIKFTPIGKAIHIKCFLQNDGYVIKVIDEGCGIDENLDLFAPFKRYGNKSGVGLGLFLAQGAANAIGAEISLKNRKDKTGAIATLFIPIDKKS
ncbi:MAG: HAMP domain-containing sensor histidine kinase [Sulfurospirillaceae bacterium]|nr:HAMP domain-containing sensor histidine kinase [Sulfurospirillaceae bacterium]